MYSSRSELAARFKGEGVELGVAAGEFSAAILANGKCSRLWSVDRWSDHHNLEEYKEAASKLANAGRGRCVPLRMSFDEALRLFTDESLNFVYIDGYAHTGQESGKTLDDWWPKLRPGGIFAGHDYCDKWPKTIEAVDTFAKQHGCQIQVTGGGDQYPSWWIEKAPLEVEYHQAKQVMNGFPVGPGSSVILIGNGPSAKLRGPLGSRIDQFDEVVRFNTYAVAGFEKFVGTKTTLWCTFGRGSRPRDTNQRPQRALFVFNSTPKNFGIPVDKAWGIPYEFYAEIQNRVKQRSKRENPPKELLPSSGLVVVYWMLEKCGVEQITLHGFDHFAKKESRGHHYWLEGAFALPPEHDGVAEAELFTELKSTGKITYLR